MVFNKSRGQSALEYLMTYGWALIVIVVVIAALVVLVPKPATSCTGFGKLTITNFNLTTTGLQLSVTNGTGKALTGVIYNGKFTQGGTQVDDVNATTIASVAAGTSMSPTIASTLGGGQTKVDLTVYYNDGDYDKIETGTCSGSL